MALKVVKRYRLDLHDKLRYYTFQPDGESVIVERWARYQLEYRRTMERAKARRLWRWLTDRCGYMEW
jgi:hypothetical protein